MIEKTPELIGPSDRTESGRTAIQDQRMLRRAIREGWLKGDRFETDATEEQIIERCESGKASLKDLAMMATLQGLTATRMQYYGPNGEHDEVDDHRTRQIAVKNVVAMERVNQADDHKETPDLHLHAHQGGAKVVIMMPDNGRDNHRPAAGASNVIPCDPR